MQASNREVLCDQCIYVLYGFMAGGKLETAEKVDYRT